MNASFTRKINKDSFKMGLRLHWVIVMDGEAHPERRLQNG
nr:MAG TPA: hypothetical protein [Caudoviricetes sp.]